MAWRLRLRFTNLRYGMLAVILLLSACSKESLVPAEHLLPKASAKNILLICIDTVRADVFYGLGDSRKDSFSVWQDRATVFERATSSSSWTAPAIGSVFSGLWQSGHGAGQLPSPSFEPGSGIIPASAEIAKPTALYEAVPLLTEAAAQEGFHTAVISASPWTNALGDSMGLNRGFKEKFNIGSSGSRLGFSKMKEAFARKQKDAPFFYYLHFLEAHDWHMAPEPKLNERIAKFSPEERAMFLQVAPPRACEDEQSLLCKRYLVYASAVSRLRKSIATMLVKMERENLLDDTVVILFSDHGEEFGDHDGDKKLVKAVELAPGRFIGHGQSMYQELLHVPLIVWHPESEGAVIDRLVSLVDIAPTVARWLNIDFLPDQWPGYYLDDHIEPSQKALDRVVYASGIVVGEQQMSAQQGAKKSIWYMASDQDSYFDLDSDPYEIHSEPSDNLVLLFDGLFLDYTQSERDAELESAPLTNEQIKRLQAIGYLQGLESDADTKKN
ncbi:MAG: sulfatase [Halioglobus sp.]|nr:sulfatase [Halioglobus sp.]